MPCLIVFNKTLQAFSIADMGGGRGGKSKSSDRCWENGFNTRNQTTVAEMAEAIAAMAAMLEMVEATAEAIAAKPLNI